MMGWVGSINFELDRLGFQTWTPSNSECSSHTLHTPLVDAAALAGERAEWQSPRWWSTPARTRFTTAHALSAESHLPEADATALNVGVIWRLLHIRGDFLHRPCQVILNNQTVHITYVLNHQLLYYIFVTLHDLTSPLGLGNVTLIRSCCRYY